MPLPPLHIQEYLTRVIDWTSTNRLLPCQVQQGPAHGSWSLSSRQKAQGNTRHCEMVVLLKLEFLGVEQNLVLNTWQLVFANIPVQGLSIEYGFIL